MRPNPSFSDYNEKLSALHPNDESSDQVTPPYLRTLEYIHYAESYILAAGNVADNFRISFLPLMQLTGHAIECAMKACISATGRKPPTGPEGHSLVGLGDCILSLGFEVTEQHKAFVVHINHLYASDLASGSRYKARYPSQKLERLGGSIPPHDAIRQLVKSLCRQAVTRNEGQSPANPRGGA
jgi:hypothetical protein